MTSYGVYHTSMSAAMCRINGELKVVILGMATRPEASFLSINMISED